MATVQRAETSSDQGPLRRANPLNGSASALHRGQERHDQATLAQVIEGEIIPRLLMAHQGEPIRSVARANGVIHVLPLDVDTLAPMVLREDTFALLRHVEGFLARGVSVRELFVELLAPVARKLGDLWDADACDFIDVTMGLWRLQEVVREVSCRTPGVAATGVGRSALFAPMPGEQHSFGSVMVEELFRRSGWETASARDGDQGTLTAMLADQAFDLVGLTVACADHLEQLPGIVAELRSASRNRGIVVMVGGAAVGGQSSIAIRVGADGTAANAAEAVATAEMLLSQNVRHVRA